MKVPRQTVQYLVWKFDLNNCEGADLSSWAEWLVIPGENGVERTSDDVRAQLVTRAEVLSIIGSPFQEMYDSLEKESNRSWKYTELDE